MPNDADYAAYLAARWPFLVRSLVLIGCPRSTAEDVVQSGLARCYPSWDKVREADDVDVHVYRTVLDRWHRSHTKPVSPFVAGDDATDEQLVRQALEAELSGLAPERREELVLRYVAELTEDQVADVLEGHPGSAKSGFTEADFRTAREIIDVGLPPYDIVMQRVGQLRRRKRRVAMAAVAGGVLVVAGLAWVSTRPAAEPESEPQPDVITSHNPIDQSWYGSGWLQLTNVAVELSGVSSLVEVGGGAVYVDEEGALVNVGSTGEVTTLGRTPVGSPVVASDERSWVAWVTPGDEPELVVEDTVDAYEVARVAVLPGAWPVALDQNRVYFLSEGRTMVWEPLTGRVEDIGARVLLDVESAVRVYGDGASIDMVQPFFSVDFRRPGVTADLSSGGTYVLSRRAGEADLFHPLIYDARSGDRLPTGIRPGERVLDAVFGPDQTIDYLVVQAADEGIAVLRTCDLVTSECAEVVPLPRGDEEPRLAH